MLYKKTEDYTLYQGKMQDELKNLDTNSIDSIVTDPPYELGFMNKGWDSSGVAFQKSTWEECFRVLKPGGYLLAFGGSRTFHRIAVAIEDAGFEIRDCIMWLYGCLSEDTEILTKHGFKKFIDVDREEEIRVYDIKNGIYKWEKPERWNVYSLNKDTCFRIKSDSTDQLVSRNHRCLVEQDGNLVFKFAENLSGVERVPVLSYNIPYLQEGERVILFKDLLWQDENLAKRLFSEWQRKEEPQKRIDGGEEPFLERWCNAQEQKRELFCSENKVCSVSERVYDNGEKRWVCDGAQIISSTADRKTLNEVRGCSSHKSQCRGQQFGEFNAVQKQSRPQEIRKWSTYTTSLATVTKEEYTGVVFCPTVSTGCFVARRNGKVFITGNSGFPKSMDISKSIESKLTNGSANTQSFKDLKGTKVESGDWGIDNKRFTDGDRPQDYSEDSHLRTVEVNYQTEEGKQWKGWGTCLKPAYEPIIMARKPCEGSTTDNVLTYGVGGINIDECRVGNDYIEGGTTPDLRDVGKKQKEISGIYKLSFGQVTDAERIPYKGHYGRFPANIITDGSEEVAEGMPDTKSATAQGVFRNQRQEGNVFDNNNCGFKNEVYDELKVEGYSDSGSAMRYFYCAKASKKDRDEGCQDLEDTVNACSNQAIAELKRGNDTFSDETNSTFNKVYKGKNIHPTVKPTELMQYLIRLVSPKGATILDPFMGSGSTGKAVMIENIERNSSYKFIGIELTEEYLPVCEARIEFGRGYVADTITVDKQQTSTVTTKVIKKSLF